MIGGLGNALLAGIDAKVLQKASFLVSAFRVAKRKGKK